MNKEIVIKVPVTWSHHKILDVLRILEHNYGTTGGDCDLPNGRAGAEIFVREVPEGKCI